MQYELFTTSNDALSSYQEVLLCILHSEVWCCVWIFNSGKSTFLHLMQAQQELKLWGGLDHPNFHLFIHQIAKKLSFLFFLWNEFTFSISRKNVGKLTVIQTSMVPHNSVQNFLWTKKLVLWGCTLLQDRMRIPDFSHRLKLPSPQIRLYLQTQYLVQWKTNCDKFYGVQNGR